MFGAWGWEAQEESSNLGKGVGRRVPVIVAVTDARGGTAATDCVGCTGSVDRSRLTHAMKSS